MRELLTSVHFSLDLVLELANVELQLVTLLGPHSELLDLKLLAESLLIFHDILLGLVVNIDLPSLK